MTIKKIVPIFLAAILLCTLPFTALAATRLEITQVEQNEGELTLYTLLSDADTLAPVQSTLSTDDVTVSAGSLGTVSPTSVTRFSDTSDPIAYTIIIDLNTYAFSANRIKDVRESLKTLLYTLRDNDSIMLLTTDKTTVNVLTNDFISDRLQLNSIIDGLSDKEKGTSTKLYSGIERAITAFSTERNDFPARKMILVYTYGTDGSGIAADVLAEKAAKSGVPINFIMMRGSYDGKSRTVDTDSVSNLDRIARAAHGRVIDGRTDLDAATTLIGSYVQNTQMITITPPSDVWSSLAADLTVRANYEGTVVSNDADASFATVLRPTVAPIGQNFTATLVWEETSSAPTRPESISISLVQDGVKSDTPQTLSADNNWSYTWTGLADGATYTVAADAPDGYVLAISAGTITATEIESDVEPEEVEARISHTVRLEWIDEDNQDELRPESVTVSLLHNGVNTNDPQQLFSETDWAYTWTDLPAEGTYSVVADSIDRYDLSYNDFVITAEQQPITLLQRLTTPPILYVVLGVIALLIILAVVLIVSQVQKRAREERERAESEYVPPLGDSFNPDDSGTMGQSPFPAFTDDGETTVASTPFSSSGEETIGLYDKFDPEATLALDSQGVRVSAAVEYNGTTKTESFLLNGDYVIGRSIGNAKGLHLDDPHVSRTHCKLSLLPHGLYVTDMGSRSGTFLNDTMITSQTAVKTGDVIRIGKTNIKLTLQL